MTIFDFDTRTRRSRAATRTPALCAVVCFNGVPVSAPILGDFSVAGRLTRGHPANDSGDQIADMHKPVVAPLSASVVAPPCHVESMTGGLPVRSEFPSASADLSSARKDKPMSFTAEAIRVEMTDRVQETVRYSPGSSVKARLTAAARLLGLSVGRVADYVYGEVRRVEAHEADTIRANHEVARKHFLAFEAEYRRKRDEMVRRAPGYLGALLPPSVGEVEE